MSKKQNKWTIATATSYVSSKKQSLKRCSALDFLAGIKQKNINHNRKSRNLI